MVGGGLLRIAGDEHHVPSARQTRTLLQGDGQVERAERPEGVLDDQPVGCGKEDVGAQPHQRYRPLLLTTVRRCSSARSAPCAVHGAPEGRTRGPGLIGEGHAKPHVRVPSLPLGILGGVAAAGVAALVLGILSVRHTRIYFAMLTLAWGMMIFSIAWKWREVTGGDDGLVGIPRAPVSLPGLVAIDVSTIDRYYYVVLAVTIVAVYALYRVARSPLGLALRAIRDSESRAGFAGISVATYRLIAFTIAGLYAGLAGTLLPPLENTVTPPVAHWSTSAEPVLATLLGGIHTFAGPIVGAALLIILKDVIVRFTVHWSIVLGATVIVLVMGFRGGVASMVGERLLRLRR